jgi:hypothetical protein
MPYLYHRYKQQKPLQVRFLSESQHTITKMSDNLNMTGTIAGKANDKRLHRKIKIEQHKRHKNI